jgi:RecA-family ATPase
MILSNANPSPHPLARFANFDGTAKAPRWVIPGFIGHGVVVISGAQGVGKTTALLPLAMTAAGLHGDTQLLPRHWRHVVYITEDIEQANRILAGIVSHSGLGIDPVLVRERLHLVPAVRLDPTYVATVGKTYREQFTRTVDGVEVLPLVVLDTKSAVLAVDDENDNSKASAMMAALKQGFDGLPVWLVGHVAKTSFSRSEVTNLSSRGASAVEADANQTLFLTLDGEQRSLVQGKTRFESRWPALTITSFTATTSATDEFGCPEAVMLRWAMATPSTQSRKEAAKQAQETTKQMDALILHKDIRDAVEAAWQAGNPLNRSGLKATLHRNAAAAVTAISELISNGWLYEVPIPTAIRTSSSKSSFLVSFTAEEREAVLAGGNLPTNKLVIPDSWRKVPASPVPEAESEPIAAAA